MFSKFCLAKTWADLGKEIKVYPSLHLYEMGTMQMHCVCAKFTQQLHSRDLDNLCA
jgi:hypothetical protein